MLGTFELAGMPLSSIEPCVQLETADTSRGSIAVTAATGHDMTVDAAPAPDSLTVDPTLC